MAADYKTLPVVLADLALVARGIVLMRKKDYWRIEDAASQARREAVSGPPEIRAFLNEARYFWVRGPDEKIVVMRHKDGEDAPFAAEPGSDVTV